MTVAFPVHLLQRNEAQGSAVDAVAQTAPFFGAIRENVAQMRTSPTLHLNADHAVAGIAALGQLTRLKGPGKAGPTATSVKLVL